MHTTLPRILSLEGRRRKRETNWQKTLKENEFDRSVQSGFLPSCFLNLRKVQALPHAKQIPEATA